MYPSTYKQSISLTVHSVNGRPAHVARLRSEFDTGESLVLPMLAFVLINHYLGADFSLVECDPGDLDPHAVASVFKAYLRERKYLAIRCPRTYSYSNSSSVVADSWPQPFIRIGSRSRYECTNAAEPNFSRSQSRIPYAP